MTPNARNKTTLFFCVILSAGFSAEATEIQLKANVQAPGSIVLLGDVATIQGPDTEQIETLRRLELFPAPSKNRTRLLQQSEVRELLTLYGIDTTTLHFGSTQATRIRSGVEKRVITKKPAAQEMSLSIVVARRNLAQGETLRSADLLLKPVKEIPRNLAPVFDLKPTVGMELTHSVRQGDGIDSRYLRRPILVRRGEPVTVYAFAAGVRVRTTAKSLGQGSLDDLILLESLETRKRFSARVTGTQKAEVLASGISVQNEGWPNSEQPNSEQPIPSDRMERVTQRPGDLRGND